jgi:hypothetical protein
MPAILFVVTLVALVIVATYVFGYASHCFLLVTQDTAAGNDEVVWPDDPVYDWIWKGYYLAWLIGFWMFPVMLILGLVNPGPVVFQLGPSRPAAAVSPGFWFVVVATVVLWLWFPLSLISSLSAQSMWVVFSPALLPRLSRSAGTLALFYAASGVLLACCTALALFALDPRWRLLILSPTPTGARVSRLITLAAAPACAAGWLIYARLLGRLAWQLGTVRVPQPEPPPKKRRRRAAPAPRAHDPWKPLPDDQPIRTPEGEVEPYGLTNDPEPVRRPAPVEEDGPRPIITPEGEVHGYEMTDEEPPPPPPAEKPEEWLQKRAERKPPPQRPQLDGVYTFPWYPTTVQAWLKLAAGFFVVGMLTRAVIGLWPF